MRGKNKMTKQLNLMKSTSLKIDASQTISDLAALLESMLKNSVDPNKEAMLNITKLIRSMSCIMPKTEVDCEFNCFDTEYTWNCNTERQFFGKGYL